MASSPRTVTVEASVGLVGHSLRLRVNTRDREALATRAAVRATGRRPSAVVSVRDDGRSEMTGAAHYTVTVATGPRRDGLTPVQDVRVYVPELPRREDTGW